MQEDLKCLIERVEAFEIDPGEKALGFAQRLARENRWTVDFSLRVIDEYKRFCVLAIASGHHVTPSEAVDQAWHLHLTYTRSYWNRFCGETLKQPLHHEPTSGGSSEGIKFHDWYSETLKSYERLFGQAPPEDIWPSPKSRFSHAGEGTWVNAGQYWLVPRVLAMPIILAILIGVICLIPGCAPALPYAGYVAWLTPMVFNNVFPFSLGGSGFLIFYGIVCIAGLIAIIILRIAAKASESNKPIEKPIDLNVDELAVLSGGGLRLAQLSLTRLYAKKRIEPVQPGWFSSGKFIANPDGEPIESAIDRDLFAEIKKGTPTSKLVTSLRPHYDRINHKLVNLKLRNDSRFHSKFGMFVVAAIILLGVARLAQGLMAGEEIGFLVLMMFAFPMISFLLNVRQIKLTAAGVKAIDASKKELDSKSSAGDLSSAVVSTNQALLMNVAIVGISAIEGVEGFDPLAPVINRMNNSSGASGGGAGCGAGCGGGGCGGGGCGGGGCGGCGG